MWQSILQGRQVLKEAARWSIGSGQSVEVEGDNWLADGNQARLRPGSSITRVSQLIDTHHRWDEQALRANLTPTSAIAAVQTPIS